jgi:hypothetical protein
MNANELYLEAVRAYADSARVLFAPSGQEAGERGGRGPTSYSDLEAQAEVLAPLSAQVTEEAVGRLAESTPAERIELETALLAKAFTDLEVCTFLLEASEDQRIETPWEPEAERGLERSAASRGAAEPCLKLLLGEEAPAPAGPKRGRKPKDVDEARAELTLQAGDALVLIAERAADSGRIGLEGLVSIGMDEIAKAVGVVGLDIARALGKAEQVTKLYELFRDFLQRAYDSIMALLGPKIAEFVGEQVKGWVEKVLSGEAVDELLEKLYETAKTRDALRSTIMGSKAELDSFITAIEKVSGLNEAYRKQTGLVDKILPKLKYVTLIPAAKLPQGKVVLAAAFILMTGYVILVGGDYVDAPNLDKLDRVPGVRLEVELSLAVPDYREDPLWLSAPTMTL